MSEASVYRNAISFFLGHSFDASTRQALRAVLDAARPGPVQLFWELAAEAGHPPTRIRELCTGVFLLFAWGNLVDDLADGDCDYLNNPSRSGPIAAFMLKCLTDEYLLQVAKIPSEVLARVNHLFANGAALGLKELQIECWDAARWLEVTEGIAGDQYQAYLHLIWHGTRLEPLCQEVGERIGLVGSLHLDTTTADPRYTSISPQERTKSEARIRAHVHALFDLAKRYTLPSIELLLKHLNWRPADVCGC